MPSSNQLVLAALCEHLRGVESFRTFDDDRCWHVFHERYEFVTIQGGHARALYRGKELAGCPNTIGVFEPDTVHRNPDNQSTSLVLIFEPHYLASLVPDCPPPHRVHFLPRVGRTLAELQRSIRRAHRLFDEPGDALELEEALVGIVAATLAMLAENRHGTASVRSPKDPGRMQQLRERLDLQIDASLTLTQLARELDADKLHLLRGFKAWMGITPHQYVIQRRVSEARRLLAEGHSIAQVACGVGFVDQSHLTRHFRRIVGVTPARYQAG